MCLRVLGYAKAIESKGTWPTNYIAKAQELKLMKDIAFASYNDGAKRGDIALLIWNMLRTPMWEITSESEGNGLASEPNRYMLNVKFADYAYTDKATFEGFEIAEDKKEEVAKVYITLDDHITPNENTKTSYDVLKNTEYEYAGNDFYTFVKGTEVEVLVNEEDKTLLTIVPTGSDKLVEGKKDAINDKYELSGDYDYAYARVEGKEVKASTTLSGESFEYVYKFEDKADYVKVNGRRLDKDDYTDDLILRNGERIELSDIKVGDIITTVKVSNGETFYVIGGSEVEGKLTKVSKENYENVDGTYINAVIGGEDYVVAKGANYVEDPVKDADKAGKSFDSGWISGMKNEEVVAKLDPVFGKVVRVEFDGHIGDGEDSTYKFFAATSDVYNGKTSKEYYIELATVDGDAEEFQFATTKEAKAKAQALYNADLKGRFVAVELNDDDEVVDVKVVVNEDVITYGTESGEYYEITSLGNAEYDKDENVVTDGSNKVLVTDNVIVVIEKTINKGKKNEEKVVEFSDLSELEGLKKKDMTVVVDKDADIQTAKYVIIKDAEKTSDNKVGKVKSVVKNKLGDYEVTLETEDGKETAIVADADYAKVKAHEDGVVVYTTETNSDDELVFHFVKGIKYDELNATNTNHGYVSAISRNMFTIEGDKTYNLTSKTFKDTYEDATIVIIEVTEDDKVNVQYKVDTITTVTLDELSLEVADRISLGKDGQDVEAVFVIRNMPEMD